MVREFRTSILFHTLVVHVPLRAYFIAMLSI